jgi:hypothetical protein
MRSIATLIGPLVVVALTASQLFAHTPVEFLKVFQVNAANQIEHAVDLQGVYDKQRISTELLGPQLFSRAVGCLDRRQKKPIAYLSWYKIVQPKGEPQRTVSVLDLVRGGEDMELSISKAEFFLSPSQSIATGTPDPVPAGLDQYKAYQVIDGAAVDREIEVVDADEKETRKLLRPLFVCIAVEEWHHDEHFASSHPRGCFVVYQLDSKTSDEKFSTIDQFGLNQLRASSSDWLCVRGALLVSGAE